MHTQTIQKLLKTARKLLADVTPIELSQDELAELKKSNTLLTWINKASGNKLAGLKPGKLLGRGAEGEVWELGSDKALKVGIQRTSDLDLELKALAKLSSKQHACTVTIYKFGKLFDVSVAGRECAAYFVITARVFPLKTSASREEINKALLKSDFETSDEKLNAKLKEFHKSVDETGMVFGDLHADNIMQDHEGNLKIVDFGLTSEKTKGNFSDRLKMMRKK